MADLKLSVTVTLVNIDTLVKDVELYRIGNAWQYVHDKLITEASI